ncbi:unnamed protein product [marine sediment metagenome]|uniref:Uncharacterized protein n=1 Tax=marine sediment metagenome TaxID=412755 RepID=X1K7K8_9ZZZZ
MLSIITHSATIDDFYLAAEESGHWITAAKGGQLLSYTEGVSTKVRQGNFGINIQVGTEVNPG